MCVKKKILVYSVLIGLGITLLTSLFINSTVIGEFPDIRFVSIPIIGVSYWGYPLPWMKQVVYPGAVKEPIWSHLIINVAYWTGLVVIVKIFYLKKIKVKEKAKKGSLISKLRPSKPAKKKRKRKAKAKKTRRKSRRK